MIKHWDYFKRRGETPYCSWIAADAMQYSFVPLSEPCVIHADGFDCFTGFDCGCAEFKLVRRTPEEIEQIEALQKSVRDESILRRADRIRAAQIEQSAREG